MQPAPTSNAGEGEPGPPTSVLRPPGQPRPRDAPALLLLILLILLILPQVAVTVTVTATSWPRAPAATGTRRPTTTRTTTKPACGCAGTTICLLRFPFPLPLPLLRPDLLLGPRPLAPAKWSRSWPLSKTSETSETWNMRMTTTRTTTPTRRCRSKPSVRLLLHPTDSVAARDASRRRAQRPRRTDAAPPPSRPAPRCGSAWPLLPPPPGRLPPRAATSATSATSATGLLLPLLGDLGNPRNEIGTCRRGAARCVGGSQGRARRRRCPRRRGRRRVGAWWV